MKFHKKGKKPPNPEPGNYVWVKTKDGDYWRKKRGTVKEAKLNKALGSGNVLNCIYIHLTKANRY